MLRESGKLEGRDYKLEGAIDVSVDTGLDHGTALVRFAGAVVAADTGALDSARYMLAKEAGSDAVVSAAITAANFSMLDRVANAIGIPLDDMILSPSADIRDSLGVNDYPSAVNSPI